VLSIKVFYLQELLRVYFVSSLKLFLLCLVLILHLLRFCSFLCFILSPY